MLLLQWEESIIIIRVHNIVLILICYVVQCHYCLYCLKVVQERQQAVARRKENKHAVALDCDQVKFEFKLKHFPNALSEGSFVLQILKQVAHTMKCRVF